MTPSRTDGPRRHWIERLPIARDRPWLALAATLAMAAAALLLRIMLDPLLPGGFPFLTFFPAVIVTAALFGARFGGLSALLCGAASWWFFLAPDNGWTVNRGAALAFLLYVLVVGTELTIIHLLQRANANLAREREVSRSLAQTSELLFRELQHRVSNNLQVAAGLLMLQKRHIVDAQARAALDEATRRLAVIGRISRQLYNPDGNARGMRAFLEELCRDVIEASGRRDIVLRVNAEHDQPLAPDAAIPLALIVAESVSNAIEHGFAGRDAGIIDVELTRDAEGRVCVEVRDDGHGLPETFDLEHSDSLGLRIARMLAGQLSGQFALLRGSGTIARLVLPA
nr:MULTISPECIES: histidine kinase dimerization/phosphoacceptor domain -containing protein [unclassified Sphingomonas]